jgi:hypothetical protein
MIIRASLNVNFRTEGTILRCRFQGQDGVLVGKRAAASVRYDFRGFHQREVSIKILGRGKA